MAQHYLMSRTLTGLLCLKDEIKLVKWYMYSLWYINLNGHSILYYCYVFNINYLLHVETTHVLFDVAARTK